MHMWDQALSDIYHGGPHRACWKLDREGLAYFFLFFLISGEDPRDTKEMAILKQGFA